MLQKNILNTYYEGTFSLQIIRKLQNISHFYLHVNNFQKRIQEKNSAALIHIFSLLNSE